MKRILTLDGGGIRGVFTLQILARIEQFFREERNQPDLVLADVFDLIAGCSTGAIIGTFLSWGLSVGQIEDLYINHSREMFVRGNWYHRFVIAKFKQDAIARFFREHLRDPHTGQEALLGTKCLKTLLLIVMRNGSTGGSWPVTNNPRARFNQPVLQDGTPNRECNLDLPLWQLLRASTAAPTFFPPEEIEIGGQTHLFMDGGLTPYNNPALIAALTATLPQYQIGWPATRSDLHLISVGTGLVRGRMPGRASQINILQHLRYIGPALIGSVAWEQDFLCRILGDCVHGGTLDSEIGALDAPCLMPAPEQKFTYARYDEPLDHTHPEIARLPGGQIHLDDLTQIPLLQKLGHDYADKHVRKEHFYPR